MPILRVLVFKEGYGLVNKLVTPRSASMDDNLSAITEYADEHSIHFFADGIRLLFVFFYLLDSRWG
jgi:hypothetical protein